MAPNNPKPKRLVINLYLLRCISMDTLKVLSNGEPQLRPSFGPSPVGPLRLALPSRSDYRASSSNFAISLLRAESNAEIAVSILLEILAYTSSMGWFGGPSVDSMMLCSVVS